MHKKEYIKFAKLLKGKKPINNPVNGDIANNIARSQWKQIVYAISDLFESDNAQFDRAKFLSACELDF